MQQNVEQRLSDLEKKLNLQSESIDGALKRTTATKYEKHHAKISEMKASCLRTELAGDELDMGVSLPEHCGVLRVYHPPYRKLSSSEFQNRGLLGFGSSPKKHAFLTEQASGRVKVAVFYPCLANNLNVFLNFFKFWKARVHDFASPVASTPTCASASTFFDGSTSLLLFPRLWPSPIVLLLLLLLLLLDVAPKKASMGPETATPLPSPLFTIRCKLALFGRRHLVGRKVNF